MAATITFVVVVIFVLTLSVDAQSTCPSVNSVANGNVQGNCQFAGPGSTCSISCQSGYTLSGSSTITCNPDGTWSPAIPSCRQNGGGGGCPSINSIQNGFVNGACSNPFQGGSCYFSCNNGLTLVGNPSAVCFADQGRWSSPTPLCQTSSSQTCPLLNAPSNGFSTGTCSGGTPGAVCSFVCSSGYVLSGSASSLCTNSFQWSQPAPTCQSQGGGSGCPFLSSPQNGYMTGTCTQATPGAVCNFFCNQNYVLSGGPSSIQCNSNFQWSQNPPTCQLQGGGAFCPALSAPQNGYAQGGGSQNGCQSAVPGSICYFYCNAGYTLLGGTTSICNNNLLWSQATPICQSQGDQGDPYQAAVAHCSQMFPSATDTSIVVGNCQITCMGYQPTPGKFKYTFLSRDNATCSSIFLQSGSGSGICFAGRCMWDQSVRKCKTAAGYMIKGIQESGMCELHCIDQNDEMHVVYHDKNVDCKTTDSSPGKCNGKGTCQTL